MRATIELDSKDVRMIIALFLGIPVADVIPNRFNYSVAGMTAEEIAQKLTQESK